MTAGRLLDGRAMAGELRREVASRLAGARARLPDLPVPTLGVVAADVHPRSLRFVGLKERAFGEAGLAVRRRILPADADTARMRAALASLAGDPGVHGLFLQYPLPVAVDARACFDAIPVTMDVDASSAAARRLLEEGREPFVPATPEAVVRLLDAAGEAAATGLRVSGAGRRVSDAGARVEWGRSEAVSRVERGAPGAAEVTLVAGDRAVSDPLAVLLRRRGLRVRLVDADDPFLAREVGRASVLVTCAGRPGAVDGRWIADGAVVVDAGYHHADGRGDLDPEPDPGRLAAWAPARGGVGPLTVAVLMAHTLEAALRRVEASGGYCRGGEGPGDVGAPR